jgi:type I restriction enzyme M protein
VSPARRIQLGEIVRLQTGYRPSASQLKVGGTGHAIPVSAMDSDRLHIDQFEVPGPGRLWLNELDAIDPGAGKPDQVLQEGTVLMLNRGRRLTAVPITQDYVQPKTMIGEALVLYYFYILSPDPNRIMPEYLAWLLNEGPLAAEIERVAQGGTLPYLKSQNLLELEIRLPPLETQRAVVDIYELELKHHRLTQRLAEKIQQRSAAICYRITGASKPKDNEMAKKKSKAKEQEPQEAPEVEVAELSDSEIQRSVNRALWSACDTFRGVIDPSLYKEYLLTMLFVKYVSDLHDEKRAAYEERYKGDQDRVARAMARERFVLPQQSHFEFFRQKRSSDKLGDIINKGLAALEEANIGKLDGVFRNIDFNSEANLGKPKERNDRLKELLDDFAVEELDLSPSRIGDLDVIGNAYEFLIGNFAAQAGKKAGEFYTPREVSTLLTRLLRPEPGMRICDPACGSGSLLIQCGAAVPKDSKGIRNVSLYGMEANGQTWALCKMNMFLHDFDGAKIEWCDTLRNPALTEQRGGETKVQRFDLVTANPPFSLSKWGPLDEKGKKMLPDPYQRYERGMPPKSRADYAFISHMIEAAEPDRGRVAVIAPHGVLFRSGAEGAIRQALIEENILDAVVGLPPNLFYGTGIPAAILLFDKARSNDGRTDVMFVDASREFEDGTRQNRLRRQDIDKIVAAVDARRSIDKYSHAATLDEIEENDFNLNIPRYVDTYEEPEPVDLESVQEEIDKIEKELGKTRTRLRGLLSEVGL